jgi:ketosteroid isomerase-like protein
MKKRVAIAALLIGLPAAAAAQQPGAEEEVRTFLAAYDKAVSARDVAFLERALPDDYVFTGASGRPSDRAEVLKYYARERDRPSYRRLSLKHENVIVRAVGDMAVVTNDYTSQTAPLDASAAEPETTRGRHTGVFAKRNGRWMVIAEQDTEQPHDADMIERQVARVGREYFEQVKRLADGRPHAEPERSGDVAALSRLLADAFACVCEDGGITRKAQALERYKTTRMVLSSVVLMEQSVVAIDNNAAVERGIVRYVGTEGARPVDVTTRYTKTWVSWTGSWQVIADHVSVVEQ